MPVYTSSIAPNNLSDAAFRAWGSWVSGRLTAVGWVQTADTGQINWATVTAAGSINTAQGYEIWRMADALQGTYPIYLKLEYGAGPAVARPSIWYTVGTASDGAGNLTGTTTTRRQLAMSSNSATSYTWMVSGSTDRLTIASCIDSNNGALGMWLLVERTKDPGGLTTGTGVLMAGSVTTGGQSHHQQFYPWGAVVPGVETSLGVMVPTFGTGTDGVTTATYPLLIPNGPFLDPPMGAQVGFASNFSAGSTVAISIYGVDRTYIVCDATYINLSRNSVANATCLLALYE